MMLDKQIEELLEMVQKQFQINWYGIHGISHWQRVRENGFRLAELTQANLAVVELFAYLHDSGRFNEGYDPQHGKRAAEFVNSLRDTIIKLPDQDFEHLVYACRYHADGMTEAGITVQTCWDADRLDLGRVGIRPEAKYLCTDAAKDPEMIQWALRRSQGM